MKSSFLEKSKRALVLLLTGAMIATSVPSNAFAATVADDADDVIIEEVTDAVAEDAVVEEEVVAAEPSDVVEALGAEEAVEEPVGESDIVDADNSMTKILSIAETGVFAGDDTNTPDSITYTFGAFNPAVIIKAQEKPNAAGTAEDSTASTIELYKVNVGAATWKATSDDADDSLKEALKAFKEFRAAQVTYTTSPTAANKETYDAKLKVITDNQAKGYMTLVSNDDDSLFPAGVTHTVSNGRITFSVATVVQSLKEDYFVAKVYDSNEDNGVMFTQLFKITTTGVYTNNSIDAADVNANDVKFTIAGNANDNDVDVQNATGFTGDNVVKYLNGKTVPALSDSDTTIKFPSIAFSDTDNVTMNYHVYDTLSAAKTGKNNDALTGAEAGVVIGHPITISSAALAKKGLSEVDDLKFTFTNAAGTDLKTNSPFECSITSPDETESLYNGNNLTVTVKPVAGLAAESSTTKTYSAYLHITSTKAFQDEYIVYLSFKVGNDITIAPKIGDASATPVLGILDTTAPNDNLKLYDPSGAIAAGTISNPWVIKTTADNIKHVGDTFNDVVFTAKGGVGTLTLTVDDAGVTNLTKDGLKAVSVNETGKATLTVSGAIKQSAYIDYDAATGIFNGNANASDDSDDILVVKAHEFKVTATDEKGNATSAYYILVPAPVDEKKVSISIDKESLSYGKNESINKFSWVAAAGTENVTTKTSTLTITNNTDVELEYAYLEATVAGSGSKDYINFNYSPVSPIKVPAKDAEGNGGTATITISPKAFSAGAYATEVTKDNNLSKAIVTFSGTGMKTTAVALDFELSGDKLIISTPIADDTLITGGEVGVEYKGYQFACEKADTADDPTWEITDVKTDENGGSWTDADGDGVVTESGTWTSLPADKLATFTTDYGLTLDPATGKLSGTPKKDGKLLITVTATSVETTAILKTRKVALELTKPSALTAMAITAPGTDISAKKTLDMGTVKVNASEGKSETITIANLTAEKLTAVKASLQGTVTRKVEGKPDVTGLTATDYFKIVYDDAVDMNTYYGGDDAGASGAGFTIDKKPGFKTFKIVSKPGAAMVKGTYEFTVRVTSTSLIATDENGKNRLDFKVKLVVEDTPVITAGTALDDMGNTDKYTVGAAITNDGTVNAYTVAYATNNTLTYNFELASVEGSDFTLEADGTDKWKVTSAGTDLGVALEALTTQRKVIVSGTPKKSGTLKFTIKATAQNDSEITTTQTFKIVFEGGVTVTAKLGGTSITPNYVYVLNGLVKGADEATNNLVVTTASADGVKNLRIEWTDADDDRLQADRDASDKTDIYAGSIAHLTVSSPSPASFKQNESTTAVVTSKTDKDGEFKVKATITGDNVAPVTFYVYQVVADNIALAPQITKTMEVGTNGYIEIAAGNTAKDVSWAEVGGIDGKAIGATGATNDVSRLTDTTKGLNISGTIKAVNAPNYAAVIAPNSKVTSYIRNGFINNNNAITVQNITDAKSNVTGAEIKDITGFAPTKAGSYTIFVEASTSNAALDPTKHVNAAGVAESATTYENEANAYPQVKAYTQVDLTVEKSTKVNIKNVTNSSDISGTKGVNTKYDLETGITRGSKNNDVYSVVEAYTLKGAAVGYDKNDNIIHVGLSNTADANMSDAKITISKDTDGKVKFAPVLTAAALTVDGDNLAGTISGTGTVNDPYKLATVTKGKTTYIDFQPVDGLEAGTHKGVITIQNDNMAARTLELTFVVSEKTYEIDAEYIAGEATITQAQYLDDRDENKLTSVVRKNTVVATSALELTPVVINGTAGANDEIFIRNTGNSPITSIRIDECDVSGNVITDTSLLKLKTGWNTATNAVVSQTTGSKTITGPIAVTADDNYGVHITVAPYDVTTVTNITNNASYLKLTVNGGTTPASMIIPVHFTVYAKDLTNITAAKPTANPVELTSVSEGYASTDATGGEFEITNTAGTTEIDKTLYDLNITLSGKSVTDFMVVSDVADEIGSRVDTLSGPTVISSAYNIKKLEPGKTIAFKVVPIETLDAGSYQVVVTIASGATGNLKSTSNIKKTLNLTITKSESYSMDVFSQDAWALTLLGTYTGVEKSFAQRVYTSLYALSQASNNASTYNVTPGTDAVFAGPKAPNGETANHTTTVTLDVNGRGGANTVITFYGNDDIHTLSANKTDVAHVVDMKVERKSGQELANESYTISNIVLAANANNNDYFTTLVFNEYSVVKYSAKANIEFLVIAYKTYEKDSTTVEKVGTGIDAEGTTKGYMTGRTVDGVDNIVLYTSVKNGSHPATAFADGLPNVYYKDGVKGFGGWETNARSIVSDTTKVTGDDLYVATWHEHQYPDSTKGNSEFVTWTWSADFSEATVTVKCTDPRCPDSDKGAISYGKAEVSITPEPTPADCVHGERITYKAKTTSNKINGKVYSDEKTGPEGQPKGHSYQPTVIWTYSETSKAFEPSINLVCTECKEADAFENRALTVSKSDITYTTDVKKEATCTEEGEATYMITGFTAAGKSYTPADFALFANVKWSDTEKLPKKGHTAEFTISDFNEETLKGNAVVVCPVDNVKLYEGELTATENADGTFHFTVTVDGAEYTYDYSNHAHKWSDPVWTWTPADEGIPTAATATFTCSVGGETKTENAVITFEADGDKYIDYTAKVTFNKKDYTDVITIDAATGKRTTKHTDHVWTASVSWDEPTFNFDDPTVVVTYTCKYGEKKNETVEVTKSAPIVRKGNTYYELTLSTTDPSGKAVTDKKYVDSTGTYVNKSAIGPENPEFEATQVWNLFYTDNYKFEVDSDIEITGAFTGTDKGQFFTVSGEGGSYEVKYTGDAKKRKSAASKTTFSAPAKWSVDGEDVTGTFQITVPTEYVKPALKLSTAKANFYTVGEKEQKVSTTVMVQNEVGNYQSMNFDDYNIDVTDSKMFGYNGTAKFSETDSYPPYGNLVFTATGKSNGKITIQGENWVEAVALPFSVVEVKKHSLTVGNKNSYSVTMNSTTPALVTTIYPRMDGTWLSSFEDMPALTVTPKKSGGPSVTFDDTTGAIVITNADDDGKAIAAKGSFTYEITDPNSSKLKLTVKVTDKALTAKNVKLKVAQKMNLITGQSLVLNATLKDVNGYISSVEVMGDADESKFEVSGGSNIYVTPKEGATMDTKTKETINLKITVSDGDNDVAIENVSFSFKAVATAPTFKVQKAFYTVANSIVSVNFTSTYKNGAKHQVKLNPTSMKQIKGQDKFAALTYEDGDQKGNVIFNEDGSFSGTVKVAKGSASAQFEATYTFVNANGEALNGSLVKKGAVSIAQKK